MPGERRKLARIARLVEGEEDEREVRLVAEAVEQRLEAAHIIRPQRNIARPCRGRSVGRASALWLRNEPGWSCMTMPSSTLMAAISVSIWARNISASSGLASPVDTRRNRASASACERSAVLRRRMAVIGGGRAIIPEEGAPLAMRVEIAAPGGGVASRDLAKAHEIVAKTFEFRIDDRIGAIGRDHAAVPARLPNGLVVLQRIERALGRGDGLDAEALEQRARAEFRRAQARRRFGRNTRRHWPPTSRSSKPNRVAKVWSSHSPRRRAAKEMVMRGETGARSRAGRARRCRRPSCAMPRSSSRTPWL